VRAREKGQLQREAKAKLEQEVARRTAELSESNRQLVIESRERGEAEKRYRAAREELAQANRLGSLGQITAGVAHEINQPVAAIRTFAENAAIFLDRDQTEPVRGNLAQIIDLTARIGTITAELRNFARRKTPRRSAIELASVIDGALLLLGERAREVVAIDLPADLKGLQITGDRVRLEQIIVNLLQNALDAIEGVAAPQIRIAATVSGDDVTVAVSDNGAGIDPVIADEVFAPFVSAKPAGLGLGLAIARDIARDFGGELEIGASDLPGATFLLRLKRA
jgi:two-component system C4-dicarboxylate transport sensor histidine kinase DctB